MSPSGDTNPTSPNKLRMFKSKKEDENKKDDKKDDGESNNDKDKDDKPKPKDFEAKPVRRKPNDISDPVTELNTRLNALLYHTSNETVDMYKQENNSSDLLGRLYYDDFDSESATPSISETGTPLLSPNMTGGISPPPGYFHTPAKPEIRSPLAGNITNPSHPSSREDSLVQLGGLAQRSLSANHLPLTGHPSGYNARPPINRLKSLERGISFDTSTDHHHRSLTLKVKHPNFKFRRNNKTFLAGFNNDQESLKAIEWLFEEMIVHGDTIIVLQVLDEKQHDAINNLEANKALSKIESLNSHYKKVQIVFEIVIGKPQKLLKQAIDEYNPQMMCIGTHHANKEYHKSFLSKASFSKYFLECALVPVIVVKPTYNHVEYLEHPLDSEYYFQDLIKNVDPNAVHKEKTKRMSKLNPLSPSASRSNSNTNLASLERGRDSSERSRSSSRSRSTSRHGFAKFFSLH